MPHLSPTLEAICSLSRRAGEAIMAVYQGDRPTDLVVKSDSSPVTAADLAAHGIIMAGLSLLTPNIPVLSEESPQSWEIRKNWSSYWLVDPLDGTKEFLAHNDEFTVNIALIEGGEPVMGVVYAPALDVLYAAEGQRAWKEEGGLRQGIRPQAGTPPMVVCSRSHRDTKLTAFLERLGDYETTAVGSSLKFCLVAEGSAQLYPRFGPTNVWDTAAGHAVVRAVGLQVNNWQDIPLSYAPAESFLNPGFYVSSNEDLPWKA
ncbi:3'(2'),5'-bisphosphate nucleotidase CysQ [Leminorella grimontii]|uniref:3'(2'),5'-bisphosphate nucleotidase CysQ n=1 Tax=Leminorella grimontii TaxID=82981 RepID=A0AAV5N6S5_9GAMM|nr:3'(2'),5'-bisphosphate nucleotidase CysQ [Leminorella grimontii]KFC94559.1 3'(2'),5'-bisphosphate nucleotidase [Leminorella grimontii ATCC 33999 = DSM 5078]GKX56654.1 3'(2'),5'-bisphosphate nucleotidase CysQ [Leminorella grimontii]GKX59745.1 3'(2'),5'-bisphosphate nucleotidase CysQ [Leminorella grimontii]VFS61896.1 3'(2'),5'-bisphosphate nucleotidase CysQ [Leminorella grimontii]